MFLTKITIKHLIFILLIIIIYFETWYITSTLPGDHKAILIDRSVKTTPSANNLCYPPNESAFARDQLRKLIIATEDARSVYPNQSDASNIRYLPNNYSTLSEFINISAAAIMSRQLIPGTHSIQILFYRPPLKHMARPSCDGLWMEFGVFRGSTISKIAYWKKTYCGSNSQPVYGFDTFSGLPTDWRPGYDRGAFDISNQTTISVPSNVVLVKGLFIDTLPTQLRLIDQEYQCTTPVSFVNIDCDIYDGARDVLFLLGSRLVPGSIIVFDELFNYPGYEKHEIKALFEFLSGTNLRLIPLGSSTIIELNPTYDTYTQSFAFLVD